MISRLARRKCLAVVLVGLAPLLVRLALLPWFGVPQPRVMDEFSHLLVADTFAHGRLANPVPSTWIHFESMHILVRSMYASSFPIGPGLLMAAGQALTGLPWTGVWLSVGIMCGALCWMLQGWVSPGWALLGGALAAARFGIFGYWMNSYWGGAVAAAGGALALGALPRIFRKRRARDAVLFGFGLVILANSRPYEGLVFSLPLCGALAVWMIRKRDAPKPVLTALTLVLATGAAGMSYYFYRVTGNPVLMPYVLNRHTMSMAPHFIFQALRPRPVYYHRELQNFYARQEMARYQNAREHPIAEGALRVGQYCRFYFGPFLAASFLTLPWMWRNRRTRLLLLAELFFIAGLLVEVWYYHHYAAPAAGLALLLVVQGMRQLRLWRLGKLVIGLIAVGCALTPIPPLRGADFSGAPRAQVIRQLYAIPGDHLVIVHYRLDHDSGNEWVYNSAEIDHSRIVWAREMDPESNQELIRYFKNRRVWLLEPDVTPPRLSPFDVSSRPDPRPQFVKLGTQEIPVLRSPGEIQRKIQEMAERYPNVSSFACDQWNYLFSELTGFEPPNPEHGCFAAGRRGDPIRFGDWFAWLLRQD